MSLELMWNRITSVLALFIGRYIDIVLESPLLKLLGDFDGYSQVTS